MHNVLLFHARRVPCLYHPLPFIHPNINASRIQITKLFIMRFSAASSFLSSLFSTNIPLRIVFSSFLVYDDHHLLRCYAVQSERIPLTFRINYYHHPQEHRLLSKQIGSSKHSSATLPFTYLSSSSSLKTEAV